MSTHKLAAAALMLLASMVLCCGKPPGGAPAANDGGTGSDAGRSADGGSALGDASASIRPDAASTGADAGSTGADAAAVVDSGPPVCSTPTLPAGRKIAVKFGSTQPDFGGTDFDSDHDDGDYPSQYFDLGSVDSKHVLEVSVGDDFAETCPAVFDLPTDQAPAGIFLYAIEPSGKFTALYDSDSKGSKGKLTIDAFSVRKGSESISFKCVGCVLARSKSSGGDGGTVAPPSDGGTGSDFATLEAEVNVNK